MENRYLFKGKRKDNGKWVFGDLVHSVYKIGDTCVGQYGNEVGMHEVDSLTICQCIGIEDKNGKLIFENDIVRIVYDGIEHIYIIKWDVDELDFKATNGKENYGSNFQYLGCCEEVEIIGNFFNNPELLEKENRKDSCA